MVMQACTAAFAQPQADGIYKRNGGTMRTKKRLKQIFCPALCLCMVLSMSVNASAEETGQAAGGGYCSA